MAGSEQVGASSEVAEGTALEGGLLGVDVSWSVCSRTSHCRQRLFEDCRFDTFVGAPASCRLLERESKGSLPL